MGYSKLVLQRYKNGELFSANTDDRDKTQLENYINNYLPDIGGMKDITDRLSLGSDNQLKYKDNTQFDDPNDLINKAYADNNQNIMWNHVDEELSKKADKTEVLWKFDDLGVLYPKTATSIGLYNQRIINAANPIDNQDVSTKDYVDRKIALKQDKLTAGANITITTDNVISSSSLAEDLWTTGTSGTTPTVNLKDENQTLSVHEAQMTHVATDAIDATGVSNFKIATMSDAPTNDTDLVNKKYIDENIQNQIQDLKLAKAERSELIWSQNYFLTGETRLKQAGVIDMQNKKIQNLADPQNLTEATTKNYVDTKIATLEQKLLDLEKYIKGN